MPFGIPLNRRVHFNDIRIEFEWRYLARWYKEKVVRENTPPTRGVGGTLWDRALDV